MENKFVRIGGKWAGDVAVYVHGFATQQKKTEKKNVRQCVRRSATVFLATAFLPHSQLNHLNENGYV